MLHPGGMTTKENASEIQFAIRSLCRYAFTAGGHFSHLNRAAPTHQGASQTQQLYVIPMK